MSLDVTTPAGMVTRYWKTGIIIGQASLDGITNGDPAAMVPDSGERCQHLPCGSFGGYPALKRRVAQAMNSLADAGKVPPVTEVDLDLQVWRGGYDRPAFASQSRFAGWVILAATAASRHSESGCLSFADPRSGSAMTAMPGLPFGRQFVLRPLRGAMAVVPGWLTASVVPLEKGQQVTVAVATGR